jgi:V/A-type H+-transporting ATPase subunit D
MARLNIAPTRSNLLLMKTRLEFSREGFSILDKKREVLTAELLSVVTKAEEQQNRVWVLLDDAYRALEHARLSMGQERVEWAALAVTKSIEVNIINHGMMGVPVPKIEAHGEPPDISYSLGDTSVALDESNDAFRKVLDQTPLLTELVTSVWRLARELKKTQRRVHALEKIFIPQYEETIRYIENTLEEQDREEIFRLKWLKSNKGKEMVTSL